MDLPVSSTCSVLMNLFINYQVYWKTLVNMNSINVMLMYTLHITHQGVLESKSAYIDLATSGTWDPGQHFSSYSVYIWCKYCMQSGRVEVRADLHLMSVSSFDFPPPRTPIATCLQLLFYSLVHVLLVGDTCLP